MPRVGSAVLGAAPVPNRIQRIASGILQGFVYFLAEKLDKFKFAQCRDPLAYAQFYSRVQSYLLKVFGIALSVPVGAGVQVIALVAAVVFVGLLGC